MTARARKNGGKTADGKFAPGNPGKPKGARHRATMAVEALLQGDAERLGRKAVELAMEGDTVALRLCLERIAPVRRGRPVAFRLPRIATPADLVKALGAVVAHVASGELTTEEGAAVAALLDAQRRAVELVDVEERLAKLEERAANGG